MTTDNVASLKKVEAAIIDRTKKGYYCCKKLNHKLYSEMINACSKYCTPTMLGILQHEYSTQKRINKLLHRNPATK